MCDKHLMLATTVVSYKVLEETIETSLMESLGPLVVFEHTSELPSIGHFLILRAQSSHCRTRADTIPSTQFLVFPLDRSTRPLEPLRREKVELIFVKNCFSKNITGQRENRRQWHQRDAISRNACYWIFTRAQSPLQPPWQLRRLAARRSYRQRIPSLLSVRALTLQLHLAALWQSACSRRGG